MATIFLDRDDTLIACNSLPAPPPPGAPGDLVDPALVSLLDGVLDACRALRAAGHTLVVVSNQGSVARGAATIAAVERVNRRVDQLLRAPDGSPLIRSFYFCPFHPKGSVALFARDHAWRKPAPGMILAAAADLTLDPRDAWLIGDAPRDIEAGRAAGIPAERCLRVGPDLSFAAAAARVLAP